MDDVSNGSIRREYIPCSCEDSAGEAYGMGTVREGRLSVANIAHLSNSNFSLLRTSS